MSLTSESETVKEWSQEGSLFFYCTDEILGEKMAMGWYKELEFSEKDINELHIYAQKSA